MAGVGLVIPPGSKSLANTDPPLQTMDLSAHPWDFKSATQEFIAAHNRRYGQPRPGNVMADVPGLHATTTIPVWLSEIAAANPGWFEANGLGKATGSLTPSAEEIHDAQAALVPGRGRATDLLAEEHSRLFPGGDLIKPGGEPRPEPDPLTKIREQAGIARAFLLEKGTQEKGGGQYARELRNLLKAIGAMLILALLPLLSGCAAWRVLNPFDNVTAADIEFAGKKTGEVAPLTVTLAGVVDERLGTVANLLAALGQDDPLGVIMRVDVVGEAAPRYILCTEQWVQKCRGIPVNDTIHFAGRPAGLYWRPSRLTADNFND